tara:strand:- start:2075 stop:2509 length:435 start_codon:yes stop_codon:yes gene_type:complete
MLAAIIPILSKPLCCANIQVIPPKNKPSKKAYEQIKNGLFDLENITIKADIKLPMNPIINKILDSGIIIEVAIAEVAVIKSNIPVFSDTPSIDIWFEFELSHQFISLYIFLSNVESERAGFPERYILCAEGPNTQTLGFINLKS